MKLQQKNLKCISNIDFLLESMVQRNLANKVGSDNWKLCSGKSELFSTSEVPAIYLFIMLSYAHIYVILLVLCLPLQDSASGQSYRNKQASERSSYGTRNRYLYHNRRYPTSAAQKRKTKGKKSDPFKTNIYFSVAIIGIPYILYRMLCIFFINLNSGNKYFSAIYLQIDHIETESLLPFAHWQLNQTISKPVCPNKT